MEYPGADEITDEKWRPTDYVSLGDDVGHHFYTRMYMYGSGEYCGIQEFHWNPTRIQWCYGYIPFDIPVNPSDGWQVQSYEPLTLSPSLQCRACGNHGFIREGRWIQA